MIPLICGGGKTACPSNLQLLHLSDKTHTNQHHNQQCSFTILMLQNYLHFTFGTGSDLIPS